MTRHELSKLPRLASAVPAPICMQRLLESGAAGLCSMASIKFLIK